MPLTEDDAEVGSIPGEEHLNIISICPFAREMGCIRSYCTCPSCLHGRDPYHRGPYCCDPCVRDPLRILIVSMSTVKDVEKYIKSVEYRNELKLAQRQTDSLDAGLEVSR